MDCRQRAIPAARASGRTVTRETLRGADVVIIADKDKAGRDHAQLVAGKLHGIAKSVRVLELPDVNGKPVKDAADYFNAGGDAGQIYRPCGLRAGMDTGNQN